MQIEIRQYRTHDAAAAAAIWNEVVRGGVAFPQQEELTEENADSFFRSQSFTGLAEDAETGEIVGLYILHPNNVGRCGHICNTSYAVKDGLRGAASMAFALDPGVAMVLEGTTAADLAEVKGADAVCRVRGGVVLPFMDGATIYDAALFELLRDACIKRGIPWQTKTRVAGGTDAGRIHRSRAGVRVCAAAAPVRYIHSPSSVAAKADCEAVLAAARAFLEELGGDDE